MPFYGHTGIPDPKAPDKTVAGTVRSWSVAEGAFAQPDQELGTVDVGGKTYGLVICFPALIDRLYAAVGSSVPADDFILKWIADGEDIPYGRSYFRLERSDT